MNFVFTRLDLIWEHWRKIYGICKVNILQYILVQWGEKSFLAFLGLPPLPHVRKTNKPSRVSLLYIQSAEANDLSYICEASFQRNYGVIHCLEPPKKIEPPNRYISHWGQVSYLVGACSCSKAVWIGIAHCLSLENHIKEYFFIFNFKFHIKVKNMWKYVLSRMMCVIAWGPNSLIIRRFLIG